MTEKEKLLLLEREVFLLHKDLMTIYYKKMFDNLYKKYLDKYIFEDFENKLENNMHKIENLESEYWNFYIKMSQQIEKNYSKNTIKTIKDEDC